MLIGTSRRESVICSLLLIAVIKYMSFKWFYNFFSLNSVCKGIKLYLHEVPDYDIAVCNPLWFTMSNLHRYFEIKSITGLMFEIITFTCISF